MPRKKKYHQIKKKKYASLTDLKEEIERQGAEKLVSFNGFELLTNKRAYGLHDGIVSVKDLH